MKGEKKFFFEKFGNPRNRALQIIFVSINKYKIIYISSIILDLEIFLDECIKRMKVKIRENLTRQVPYRDSSSWLAIEKTLGFRKSYPIGSFAFYDRIFGNISANERFDKKTIYFPLILFEKTIKEVIDLSE